jgi:hypothetical protein
MSESFGHSGGRPLPGAAARYGQSSAHSQHTQAQGQSLPRPAGMPNVEPEEVELDPIGLVDEAEDVDTASKIKAFGVAGIGGRRDRFQRTPINTGTGACRMRSFHGKLSDQGLEYLDNAVNEWLDLHPEVDVKFVTSTVGVFEGKIREPALVLNLWY